MGKRMGLLKLKNWFRWQLGLLLNRHIRKERENMKPRNIECAGADGICTICVIGEDLEEDAPCRYDAMRDGDGCPGFECAEQCRLCPEDCEFLRR